MNEHYFWQLVEGLGTSLQLTVVSLAVGCTLALLMTLSLILKTPVISQLNKGIIILFTGTPLLVQIFLVYYGPGQFEAVRNSLVVTPIDLFSI
ncbi:arginine ABC transporter permease protein ArtM [Photobacterium damselae subsp. piscicida]|nr:hypothetical protein E4T25_18795 [Photobacterium damselae subsp. piscicida]BBC42144.1 arginine ABC transporter permease protein ArtM [Photobacterium damselae subsp. piscicida]